MTATSRTGTPADLSTPTHWSSAIDSLAPMFLAAPTGRGDLGLARAALIAMLTTLDVSCDSTALVIGDGTAVSHLATALLCQALGDDAVTLALDDPPAVLSAIAALDDAKFRPNIVTAHGLLGWTPGAFYHRIWSLASPWSVPETWIQQANPRGLIVTPLGAHGETLVRLRVSDDRTHATGPTLPVAPLPDAFPPLLAAETLPPLASSSERLPGSGGEVTTDAHAFSALVRADANFLRLLSLMLPDLDHYYVRAEQAQLWIDRCARPSWARLERAGTLSGAGPRNLVAALLQLADWWTRAGMPAPKRWGVTSFRGNAAGPGAATLWVDDPSGPSLDGLLPGVTERYENRP